MGMVYLGTKLKNHGHDVIIYDAQLDNVSPMGIVKEFSPDFVGLSTTTDQRHSAFDICREVKEHDPSIKTVIGGSHCTNTGADIIRTHAQVDLVMKGYCESRFQKVVSDWKPAEAQGVVYREGGEPVETEFSGIPDPDDFVVPDYSLLELEKYKMKVDRELALPIFTSRGCSHNCTFCAAGHFTRKVSFSQLDRVLESIDRVAALGYKAIRIQDDTFGMKRKDALAIMDYLKAKGIIYSIKSRISILDEEFLEALKETGCFGIKFGVESVVPHVLKGMEKKLNLDKLERIISIGLKLGIRMGAFFIIGNPYESYEDAMVSIKFCQDLLKRKVLPLTTIGCYVFPGTKMETLAKQQGIIPDDFNWASEFSEPRNDILGYHTSVPIYTSEQLGYEELSSLRDEFRKRAFVLDVLIPF
jgi:magnesium-protoporphyrin IX monomethyl ester (oxidative) cyclase